MSKLLLFLIVFLAYFQHGHKHGSGDDRVAIFSTINVNEGETAGDIACAFCTVDIQGDVTGDIAVIFSTVTVAPDRTIGGDVAALFSTLHLGGNDRVRGDLATALSTTDIPASATVSGDRAIFSSSLGLTVIAGPILILAGIIGLIIFFVRRNRYPYPV